MRLQPSRDPSHISRVFIQVSNLMDRVGLTALAVSEIRVLFVPAS
jgi:hypothetical protein